MRSGLLVAAAAALLTTPVVAVAADPPVVFQTQPVGKLLDDLRGVASLLGGDAAVKGLNDNIKRDLGEKGFDGLDLTRPIVGYVLIPANPEESVFVVALPVTGEKEFLDLVERANKEKPKPVGNGLYELPMGGGNGQARMRVADGHAYLAAAEKDPTAALDPKALVPAGKLFDPAERAQLAGRVYFDRLPNELQAKLGQQLDDLKKQLDGLPLPPELGPQPRQAAEAMVKLGKRYADLLRDADRAAARVVVDPATGESSVEVSLSGRPGSALANDIAARKPTTNRFGGLVTKDTVAGLKLQLPLFAPEVRAAVGHLVDAAQKMAANDPPPVAKDVVDELLKGLARTVKAGEFDLAGGVRGPDAAGKYTVVAAVSFEDTSGLEKAVKESVRKEAPPIIRDLITFDKEKVGGVNVHEMKVGSLLPPEPQGVFGDDARVALAFAPKGVYVAFGPDAVGALKGALTAKPEPAPALDALVNPARLAKLVTAAGGPGDQVAQVLGKDDQLLSAFSVTVEGGKELKLRLGMNLKILPRAMTGVFSAGPNAPPPAVELKKEK
jgi:hypothetical protein